VRGLGSFALYSSASYADIALPQRRAPVNPADRAIMPLRISVHLSYILSSFFLLKS
jgi:hypothetical protein